MFRSIQALTIAAALAMPLTMHAADPTPEATVDAITLPSESRKLAFPGLGIVREVLVKDGDTIKEGQLLARQDDDLDRAEADRLKVEAESTARADAAKADFVLKQTVATRKEQIYKDGGGSLQEVEEARLDVVVRENQYKVAAEDTQTAKIKLQGQTVKVEKAQLKSPIDGFVQKVNVGAGEATDPQQREGAIVVVKNDPLYLEVRDLFNYQVDNLQLGETLKVRYAGKDNAGWLDAKIIYVAPQADAGSDTRVVKLELPNPQGVSSGRHMQVQLPSKAVARN